MIDAKLRRWERPYIVEFKNLPDDILRGAIYIENEYNKRMNRYLKRWGWWLQKYVFHKYENGNIDLTYLPCVSLRKQRKQALRQYPFLSKKTLRGIPGIETADLLNYLEDPDDARFLKPGFLFFHNEKENGITEYEYYPLYLRDNLTFSVKKAIVNILRWHKHEEEERWQNEKRRTKIGGGGVCCTRCKEDEDYAEKMFKSLDFQTRAKLSLFQKQVEELQKYGIPMNLLENIIHKSVKPSKLVITKTNDIILTDYNNMVIKMEPLVKAVFLLFLKHPEGIVFKNLPDYKEELCSIYKRLRPLGLNDYALKSIEDVTNPLLNSINEKCARIREAFLRKFDDYIAQYYCISGKRGEAKKIVLDRSLVTWGQ